MAEEQTTLDETRACVAQIEQSGKLLGDLVSDTLTISRLSGGKTPLQPAPVDTGELARSFDSAVRNMAGQQHLYRPDIEYSIYFQSPRQSKRHGSGVRAAERHRDHGGGPHHHRRQSDRDNADRRHGGQRKLHGCERQFYRTCI